MAIDPTRLENVKHLDGGAIRAACPACRAAGSDKSGNHLLIQPDGKYGCAINPKDAAHRREIFKLAGIRPAPKGRTHHKDRAKNFVFVCAYDYTDESGGLLYQVHRKVNPDDPTDKEFLVCRPDPDKPGKRLWNMEGVRRVLYRLPEVLTAIKAGLPIYVCEGEKDVLALVQHGFAATCNHGGAGKWQDSYSETLRGADVIIIADKDAPGRAHARKVATALYGVAASVRVIECPELDGRTVKDAADYFGAGGQACDLDQLVQDAPYFAPGPEPDDTAVAVNAATSPTDDNFDTVTAWIRGKLLDAANDDDTPATVKNTALANDVVHALARVGGFYYHADLRDFDSAMFFDGSRKRLGTHSGATAFRRMAWPTGFESTAPPGFSNSFFPPSKPPRFPGRTQPAFCRNPTGPRGQGRCT
jgi:5S rRNA maturation endonuclease (ribonuclease M5)